MEHREAVRLISGYIDDTLTDDQLAAFIAHVRGCPSCYEELETYFTIHYTLEYLDSGADKSYNMQALLKEDLRAKENRLRKKNRRSVFFFLWILLLFLVAAMILGILLFPDVFLDLFGLAGGVL